MISNILSANEIVDIVNDPIVQENKEKLSALDKVDFSIILTDELKNKLETGFNINLSQQTTIPLRWIKGDTPAHIDRGEQEFHNTHLLYLTDSIGNLFIDGQTYEINAGDAYVFNEGVEHYTINTGNTERLLLGPMSETGFRVGGLSSYIVYFNNETDASNGMDAITSGYNYTIETVNNISSWMIYSNIYGTDPTPNGGPYNTGDTLIQTGTYFVYPYVEPQRRSCKCSLYSNNALVFYKKGSLSTSGGGRGVSNSRVVSRRT
jgi:hypothetical protein